MPFVLAYVSFHQTQEEECTPFTGSNLPARVAVPVGLGLLVRKEQGDRTTSPGRKVYKLASDWAKTIPIPKEYNLLPLDPNGDLIPLTIERGRGRKRDRTKRERKRVRESRE